MKTNFYHVKFTVLFNNKKYIYSIDNIEAVTPYEANLLAYETFKKNVSYEMDIILKRKKGQKCKDI
jgi:hypothetical protein